jgi:hypothetical protein
VIEDINTRMYVELSLELGLTRSLVVVDQGTHKSPDVGTSLTREKDEPEQSAAPQTICWVTVPPLSDISWNWTFLFSLQFFSIARAFAVDIDLVVFDVTVAVALQSVIVVDWHSTSLLS